MAGTDAVVRLVGSIRQVRAEQELDPHSAVAVTVRARSHADVMEASRAVIERLVKTESLTFVGADAELPADEYLAASAGSPDFARYQAITLGLCGSGEPQVPGQPDDEGGVQA